MPAILESFLLKERFLAVCKTKSKSKLTFARPIDEKIPVEKLQSEELAYKLLGLIPLDYDYKNGIVSLYTEQLGGYYEPKEEYYGMAKWMPMVMQMPIAVHELTHALQDQHFNLDTFLDDTLESSDALMARSALVEGDATAVMLDYANSLRGMPSVAESESVAGVMMQNLAGAVISAAINKAPLALQKMIIFPYISGLNFAHNLLRKSGYSSLDRAYSAVPRSTEEILHPAKYPAKEGEFYELREQPFPEALAKKYDRTQAVFSDTMGEFTISTLLSLWLPPGEASEAAAGWGGDRLFLFKSENKVKGTLIWLLRWDSEKDADEFLKSFSKALESRLGKTAQQRKGGGFSFPESPVGPVVVDLSDREKHLVVVSISA